MDTTVRNVLQIDPRLITFSNPKWTAEIQALVAKAAGELGVPIGCVVSELYKVLLYEPGDFFLTHQDSEKAPGMFATLVIQLPSNHSGGAIIVHHNGETREFKMGTDTCAASYASHYMCHYADAKHEVEPITSGHRLCLVYSLCLEPTRGQHGVLGSGPDALAPGSSEELAELQLMLLRTALRDLTPHERLFVLPLEHEYTQASLAQLGFFALKGADRARHAALASGGELATCVALVCKATAASDADATKPKVLITRVYPHKDADEGEDAALQTPGPRKRPVNGAA